MSTVPAASSPMLPTKSWTSRPFSHRRTGEDRKLTKGWRRKQHHAKGQTAHTEPNAAGLASEPSRTRRGLMLRRAGIALGTLSRSRAPVSDATVPSSSVPERISLSEVIPVMPTSQPLPGLLNEFTLQHGRRKSRRPRHIGRWHGSR